MYSQMTNTRARLGSKMKLLGAALVTALGLLVAFGAASAQALPQAPEITLKPDANNTANAIPGFEFEEAEGDEDPPQFYRCRFYPGPAQASPAGPAFSNCATNAQVADHGKGHHYYPNIAPGEYTFQVQGGVPNPGGGNLWGPEATWNFVQGDLPEPTLAPQIVEAPASPQTDPTASFLFSGGEGEEGNPLDYQCRVDSSDIAAWAPCTSASGVAGGNPSSKSLTPINGAHVLEVRAVDSVGGFTPITTYQWNVDVADSITPSVNVPANAMATWVGADKQGLGDKQLSSSSKGIENAGDINGDGRDDLLAGSRANNSSPADTPMYVLFSPGENTAPKTVDQIFAKDGYAVRLSAPAVSNDVVRRFASLSDQNGDGIPDMWVKLGNNRVYVVYGVADPSSLPKCKPEKQLRCLFLDQMTADQGYAILDPSPLTGFGNNVAGAGDFDGDGTDDLVLSGSQISGAELFVKGGVERTGVVNPTTLPADEFFKVQVPTGTFISEEAQGVGDLNQDGKDDVSVQPIFGSSVGWILFGRAFDGSTFDPTTQFDSSQGIRTGATLLFTSNIFPLGDINQDGRPDFTLDVRGAGGGTAAGDLSIVYGLETPTDDFIVAGDDLPEGGGYRLTGPTMVGASNSGFGNIVKDIGDFNGDGIPDQLVSDESMSNSFASSGAAYIIYGQNPAPGEPITIGDDGNIASDVGIAMVGGSPLAREQASSEGDHVGASFASLGDLDGDGLSDFAIGAPGPTYAAGVRERGAIQIISGSRLLAPAKTVNADSSDTASKLDLRVITGGRDTDVKVEYGTSDEYGQTATGSVEGKDQGGSDLRVNLSGLEPETTYHYRVVTTTELGTLTGDDQTFTTGATPPPVSSCDIDPTGVGCDEYCSANPTAIGCPDYDWCAANPGKCDQGGGKTKARLALISITKKVAIKRGKRGVVQAAVINTGGTAAKGVKVCVKAPKKLVKVKACTKVGSLGSGASRTVKVKVKAKQKRGKAVLKLTASGNGLAKKKASAKVVVR